MKALLRVKQIFLFAALLVMCGGFQSPKNSLELFDEFWQAFEDNYAFFGLRGVDWQKQKQVYRPKVTATTDESTLYKIFCDMVDPLDDGHTSVWRGSTRFRSQDAPSWKSNSYAYQQMIADVYLGGKSKQSGPLVYGLINKTTGYINIPAMEGFEPSVIDETASLMGNLDKIIIDVRFNGGGYDRTALALAEHFTDKKQFVYSKETYYKGKYSEHLDLYINPANPQLLAPRIVVLTSRATASAAEMFVMAMTAIPNVTVVGDDTRGMHSDVYTINLSNGWKLGLSNQLYKMPDGKVYEKIGIPPDVRIPFNEDMIQKKKDNILEKAIAL